MITPYNLAKVHLFKAILPILIILHHFSFFYGYPPFFAKLGLPLVACFFLMSGYGLMTSWLKKGSSYWEGFLKHSIQKLFFPYILALLAYVPIALVAAQKDLASYFVETNFIDWLRYGWFVWVLMGGYLFFYLIFRLKVSDKAKVQLFFIVTIAYYLSALYLLDGKLPCVFRTCYAIALGILWKFKEEKIIKFLKKKTMFIFVSIFSLVGFFVTLKANSLLWNPLFSVLVFIFIAYSIKVTKVF